jgi:hypothetical protein
MFRMLLLAPLAAAVLVAGVPSGGAAGTAYEFGRAGGNILPYTVTISASGVVRASGPVAVGRTRLDASRLAALHRLVLTLRFAALPARTLCTGTLPDAAATFIRVGARRVLVHGGCVPRYTRLWLALDKAVQLSG